MLLSDCHHSFKISDSSTSVSRLMYSFRRRARRWLNAVYTGCSDGWCGAWWCVSGAWLSSSFPDVIYMAELRSTSLFLSTERSSMKTSDFNAIPIFHKFDELQRTFTNTNRIFTKDQSSTGSLSFIMIIMDLKCS